MESDTLPARVRKTVRRIISSLPATEYRWRVVQLPGEGGEVQMLEIKGGGNKGKAGAGPSETGFDIVVAVHAKGIEVACGGWHTHQWDLDLWPDEEELCSCFGGFLQAICSASTRLVVISRRGKECRWRLDQWGEEGWEPLEELVSIHWPFGRKETVILQNKLLPPIFPLPPGEAP